MRVPVARNKESAMANALATATLSLSSPRPLAAERTRPKARSPRKIASPNPKRNLKSRLVSGRPSLPPAYPSGGTGCGGGEEGGGGGGGGGEATTYTRLPPKDDYFFLDPALALAPGASREFKLSESKSIPALVSERKKPSKLPGSRDGENIPKGVTPLEELDEEDDPALEFVENRLLRLSAGKAIRNSGKDLSFEEEVVEEDDSSIVEFAKKKPLQLGDEGGSEKNQKGSSFVEDMGEFDEELIEFESDEDEVIVFGDSWEDGISDDEHEVSVSGFEPELDGEFEGFLDGDEESKEGDVKEKGVPAVMRCFDRAKIYVKAGDGGKGVVAFRREKFVPYGGPSGGDGGKGGHVYVEVDASMNSLLPFRKNIHFRAGRGRHGQGRKQAGAKGEDVVVKVAPGTVIREAWKGGQEGDVLLELVEPGQRALLLPGGRGGRGNASFKSGTNKVPKIAEIGEKGAEM